MGKPADDGLNILAPVSARPKLDYLTRDLYMNAWGRGLNRRELLGLGALGRAIIPTEASEVWADNWCIPSNAPHAVAAHAWINWLLEPSTAVAEMNYHNYPIRIPAALNAMGADLKNDPLFDVPKSYTNGYHYILNPSPQIVNDRTKIYTEFKAA